MFDGPTTLCTQAQQILCGGTYYNLDFPAHPRQLEKRRQSWGLRVKRARDDDSDCDVESPALLHPNADILHCDAGTAWKRKRCE